MCKEECSTATTDLYPPVRSVPAPGRLLLEENLSTQPHEQLDSMRRVRSPLRMLVAFGTGVQLRSGLPQGGCPPLERFTHLWPVVTLLYMYLVPDVPAAVDLRRTHPLSIHSTWEAFAIENRASQLCPGAPDTRTHPIAGPPRRGILRRSSSQLDGQACLQNV